MAGDVVPFPSAPPPVRSAVPAAWLSIEIRGWERAARVGTAAASSCLAGALEAAIRAVEAPVVVEGSPGRPTIAARFEGPESAAQALRAAIASRRAVTSAQPGLPAGDRFTAAAGVAAGEIALARTPEGKTYEITGPERLAAARLRDLAGSDQVFLSESVRVAVPRAETRPLGLLRIGNEDLAMEAHILIDLPEPYG